MKAFFKALLPAFIWDILRRANRKLFDITVPHVEVTHMMKTLNAIGLNVYPVSDFYSPLPVLSELQNNIHRWIKPSELIGVTYDIPGMKQLLRGLISLYMSEFKALPSYSENSTKAFGPGYTMLDAMLLYFMIRDLKPRRYIEIGSGLSTYYCSIAANENAKMGMRTHITCVDPYPFEKLYTLPNVEIIKKEVQDVEPSYFRELRARDVLFIDSSHVVRIGGDVPYLYLEVIPSLAKGVVIQSHDIPFPYNIPYPPNFYLFGLERPLFRTEAMLLQALLCHSDAYKIIMSMPLLRYFCEDFLHTTIPDYQPVVEDETDSHFCSIWIEKNK